MENPTMVLKIRQLMEERGLGQKALATAAGLNETYVRDILKGKSKNPKTSQLGKVAAALGVELHQILAGAEPINTAILRLMTELNEENRQDVLRYATKMKRLQDAEKN